MTLITFQPDDPFIKLFTQFEAQLYADDPLHKSSNAPLPANANLHLATFNDTVVSRCASFTRADHPDTLFIGWYESIEGDAGIDLLQWVCERAEQEQRKQVIGPINGSTWHQYRLAEPSGRTFLGDVYHKPWYAEQFRMAGFTPLVTYHSSLSAIGEVAHPSSVVLRELKIPDFDKELRTIYELSIDSFSRNKFYSLIAFDEFAALYSNLRAIVDPRLVKFAMDDNGKEVGFVFAIPDYLEPDSSTVVMKTIAVHPDHRGKGIMTAMADAIRTAALELGYSRIIYALYESSNTSGKLAQTGDVFRTYHLFGRTL